MNSPGPNSYLQQVGRFIGGWHASSLVLDLETSGFGINDPAILPVEIGWCLVEDGQPTVNDSVLVDWSAVLGASYPAFLDKLNKTAQNMKAAGHEFEFYDGRLRRQGIPALEVLEFIADELGKCLAQRRPVVGHNFYGFDRLILERACRDHLQRNVIVPAAAVIDTMLIERGRLRGLLPTGTRHAWYASLKQGRERCSLHGACAETYGLVVPATGAHTAAVDTRLTWQLLETMHWLAEPDTAAAVS